MDWHTLYLTLTSFNLYVINRKAYEIFIYKNLFLRGAPYSNVPSGLVYQIIKLHV